MGTPPPSPRPPFSPKAHIVKLRRSNITILDVDRPPWRSLVPGKREITPYTRSNLTINRFPVGPATYPSTCSMPSSSTMLVRQLLYAAATINFISTPAPPVHQLPSPSRHGNTTDLASPNDSPHTSGSHSQTPTTSAASPPVAPCPPPSTALVSTSPRAGRRFRCGAKRAPRRSR